MRSTDTAREHGCHFYRATLYASAVYAVVVCRSVSPYVHPSVARLYCTKKLNAGSRKQRRMIAQGLQFSDAKDLGEI